MVFFTLTNPTLSIADSASAPITWPYHIYISGGQNGHYRIYKNDHSIKLRGFNSEVQS